jgi:hypothetical protein
MFSGTAAGAQRGLLSMGGNMQHSGKHGVVMKFSIKYL